MRGDPELHDDGSVSVEADDQTGARYEIRVRPIEQFHTRGFGWFVPWNRPRSVAARLLHWLLGAPQLAPGEKWFMAGTIPLEGGEGGSSKRGRATVIKSPSITEALTCAVEALEGGSFPEPGEPTYL